VGPSPQARARPAADRPAPSDAYGPDPSAHFAVLGLDTGRPLSWPTPRGSWSGSLARWLMARLYRSRRVASPSALPRSSPAPPMRAVPCTSQAARPPQPDNRRHSLRLTFSQAKVEKSQRHRRSRTEHQPASNLRATVEATARSLKHPFPDSKLPVRGLFRMTCLIVASTAMTNVRRIRRYRTKTCSALKNDSAGPVANTVTREHESDTRPTGRGDTTATLPGRWQLRRRPPRLGSA
jgi:hypothetical protein